MSRMKFATELETRLNFTKALKDAVELGIYPPSDQGFDKYTEEALNEIAKSFPKTEPKLIRAAKVSLDGQFDGTNAAKAEDEFDTWVATRGKRQG